MANASSNEPLGLMMVFDTVSESVALKDDTLVSLLPPAGGPGAAAAPTPAPAAPR